MKFCNFLDERGRGSGARRAGTGLGREVRAAAGRADRSEGAGRNFHFEVWERKAQSGGKGQSKVPTGWQHGRQARMAWHGRQAVKVAKCPFLGFQASRPRVRNCYITGQQRRQGRGGGRQDGFHKARQGKGRARDARRLSTLQTFHCEVFKA